MQAQFGGLQEGVSEGGVKMKLVEQYKEIRRELDIEVNRIVHIFQRNGMMYNNNCDYTEYEYDIVNDVITMEYYDPPNCSCCPGETTYEEISFKWIGKSSVTIDRWCKFIKNRQKIKKARRK
jgi:hypothetical protein